MVRKGTELLQVKVNGEWRYVFCHNEIQGIITTDNPYNSLKALDYQYFANRYANHEFRKIKYER